MGIADGVIDLVVLGVGFIIGRLPDRKPKEMKREQCASNASTAVYFSSGRCSGMADPRCDGGNCTQHCKQHCGKRCDPT